MPCYHPLTAYRGPEGIVFSAAKAFTDATPLKLPCGKCIGCMAKKAQHWATRITHEYRIHDPDACFFVGLSYSPENLPAHGSLRPSDVTGYFKRLRRALGTRCHLRYFYVGEYGDKFDRPHYHAIIFGATSALSKFYGQYDGTPIYGPPQLESAWGLGHVDVGSVTARSISYVTKYLLKSIGVSDDYWSASARLPPFQRMSRRPGLGREFYQKFKNDIWSKDSCVLPGNRQSAPPRTYTEWLKVEDPNLYAVIKATRLEKKTDATQEELDRLHRVAHIRLSQREFERIHKFPRKNLQTLLGAKP